MPHSSSLYKFSFLNEMIRSILHTKMQKVLVAFMSKPMKYGFFQRVADSSRVRPRFAPNKNRKQLVNFNF